MAQLVNLIGSATSGGPSLDKFMKMFSNVGGGVDALASMILNAQTSLQNDLSGLIFRVTGEITKLAVANATYVTSQAIGKDVSGLPSAESIIRTINTRMQDEIKAIIDRGHKAILKPVPVGPPLVNPTGANQSGGYVRGKTLKSMSVVHRTKTHRRSAVVSKV